MITGDVLWKKGASSRMQVSSRNRTRVGCSCSEVVNLGDLGRGRVQEVGLSPRTWKQNTAKEHVNGKHAVLINCSHLLSIQLSTS